MHNILLHTILSPAIVTLICFLTKNKLSKIRDFTCVSWTLVSFSMAINVLLKTIKEENLSFGKFTIIPGNMMIWQADLMSAIMASCACLLWFITSLYSCSYLEKDSNGWRLNALTALAVSLAMGSFFSGNAISLLVCYEGMTLLTYFMVIHKGDKKSKNAGKRYVVILFTTSLLMLTPSLAASLAVAPECLSFSGTTNKVTYATTTLSILSMLMIYGTAKCAIVPIHSWLPTAMVAPATVSAILHAVAVVNVGVFSVMRLCYGTVFCLANGNFDLFARSLNWLRYASCISALFASIIASRQENIKKMLAYSTISQLSYIIIAMSLASQKASKAALTYIVAHSCAKITLFLCAGCYEKVLNKNNISELDGVANELTIICSIFFISSISLIGIPPLLGFYGKYAILNVAIEQKDYMIVFVIILCSAISASYLLPAACIPFNNFDVKTKSKKIVPKSMLAAIFISFSLIFLLPGLLDKLWLVWFNT